PVRRKNVRPARVKRKVVYTTYKSSSPSFLNFVIGFLMVGMIGGVAIWGFWNFQKRLTTKSEVVDSKIDSSDKVIKKVKKQNKKYTAKQKRRIALAKKRRAAKYNKSKKVVRKTKAPKKWIANKAKPARKTYSKNSKVEFETVELIKVKPAPKTVVKRKQPRRVGVSTQPKVEVEKPEVVKPVEVENVASNDPAEFRVSSQPAAEIY